MRKPLLLSPVVLMAATLGFAAAVSAQERVANRAADGGFEGAGVSLALPPEAMFPIFSGGWASRGARPAEVVADTPFAGSRSLRIETRPGDPSQVVQDLPLTGAAYAIHFAFLLESGSQTVRLLGDWDRMDPANGLAAFEARIAPDGIRFLTPTGVWWWDAAIRADEWHTLSVVADPRIGAQSVRFDGAPILSIPGAAYLRRSTLSLAAGAADHGVFRYDAVTVVDLTDAELAAIVSAAEAWDGPSTGVVNERIAAARAALRQGSAALALPELGIARNLLPDSEPEAADLRGAISELMALIEANSRIRPAR